MLGYRADLHAADRPSKPPRVARHGGRRYFGYGQPHRQGYGLCLRFVGVMNASDRQNVKPTRHAAAPLRPPRHNARPVMPIGLGDLVWRCGGVELTRGITVRQTLSCVRLAIIVVASAITPKTRGAALFRNVRTRRTPLCTLIFEIGSYGTAVTTKNDNGNGRPACPKG